MCGINGTVRKGFTSVETLHKMLSAMNGRIVHRGPDDDGFFTAATKEYSVGMAMRRLSIIDLNTGAQPIFSDDETLTIVFNGEIYNYRALKAGLEATGVAFKTTSDTEVILRLFEKHREKAFGMLDGMFGLSIYDSNQDTIYIARDFFGEKPLYYYTDDTTFTWASELKSIVGELDTKPAISPEAMAAYFQLTYIPAPYTIYEGIKKLPSNSFITFNCNDTSFSISEIEANPAIHKKTNNFNEAKAKTRQLVRDSVISRSVSDVPIGTFLSGGVDSSIVSLCLAQNKNTPIDTFSIGFDKKSFDESEKSRTVSKIINSNHHEFVIAFNELKDVLDSILLNFDEPFGDSSALPSYIVANKTSKHVKVALTGDGGDEVFGGYNKYYMGAMNKTYTTWVPSWMHKRVVPIANKLIKNQDDKRNFKYKLSKLLAAIDYNDDFYGNIISLGFQNTELSALLKQKNLVENPLEIFPLKNAKTLHEFREIDRLISLEGDLLVKVDRTSMLSSIECRAPFLNKNLWNFANSLPEKYLIKSWDKKHILKQAFAEYFPENFLDKSKKGFGVPVGDWLRESLKDELISYIDKDLLVRQDLFHVAYIRNLVLEHIEGIKDNTFKVWTFYCFQKWYVNIYTSVV